MSHDYDKAIQFYESNLSKVDRLDLILDLAKLYTQLKRFEKAEALLNPERFSDEDGPLEKLKQNADGFYTLYKLYLKKQGALDYSPNDNARKSIKKCLTFQQRVLEKAKSDGGNVTEERQRLADLFYEVASYTNNYEKSTEASIKMLTECLKNWPEHEKALELISTIYLKSGEVEKCQYNCELLLKINPKNDQASFILTEIMLNSNQYEKAIEQFKKILTDKPNNYPVLAKLIVFFRRNNELDKAKLYLNAAEAKASNTNDAGLCFCRGLYNKYTRNPREALSEFNKAKKSAQYAEESLVHMIDIYLNPDQDLYYSCIEDKVRMVDPENIRVCESLLREMQTRASYHRYATMEAYVVMMSGKPYNNE
jgi:tetratricopeptide repeat protein 21B